MSADLKRALVFGGSGYVGSEVVAELRRQGVETVFTYLSNEAKAKQIAKEHGALAEKVDLADSTAVQALVGKTSADIFVHCAGISQLLTLDSISDADWARAHAINVQAAFTASRMLAPHMAKKKSGHIVLVGALDRTQALPLPVHFAATQGALSALTMGLAKELGSDGILVNQVALGLLEGGLSAALGKELAEDYKNFSALRRMGTAREAAKAITWLALENTYISGKVISVNGGI
jgi:NAD(P)-dependent dehydrogenase (short-subunit alcohol dehydrogenase family)